MRFTASQRSFHSDARVWAMITSTGVLESRVPPSARARGVGLGGGVGGTGVSVGTGSGVGVAVGRGVGVEDGIGVGDGDTGVGVGVAVGGTGEAVGTLVDVAAGTLVGAAAGTSEDTVAPHAESDAKIATPTTDKINRRRAASFNCDSVFLMSEDDIPS